MNIKDIYTLQEIKLLENCNLCPHECGVDRFEGGSGLCGTDAGLNVSSVCIHRGEEPAISGPDGICNVFFGGCNLGCIYCQNHEISHPATPGTGYESDPEKVLGRIEKILSSGISAIGFVSPSHVVPQVKVIIRELNRRGYKPVTVYNTNSYDKPETLREIEGLIDVYLPDIKYVTPVLALEYSNALDYPKVALGALKEMYYQKGSVLRLDDNGRAESGMIIRHLVLPGHAEESKLVLRTIAGELSPGVNISLMSQYHPAFMALRHPRLGRSLVKEEYDSVAAEMEKLGFRNGWRQDMESYLNYRPDFRKDHPFED